MPPSLQSLAGLPALVDDRVTVVIGGTVFLFGFVPSTLDDVRPHLLDEVEAFFRHHVGLRGREIEVGRRGEPHRAHELLDKGMARAKAEG